MPAFFRCEDHPFRLHDGFGCLAADGDAKIAQTGDHAKNPAHLPGEEGLKRWLPVDFDGAKKHSAGSRHQDNGSDRKTVQKRMIQPPNLLLQLKDRRKRAFFPRRFLYKPGGQTQNEYLQDECQD